MSHLQTIYIAGPMTGLPECNYPAFHEAARRLRLLGYEVLNPAENPPPPCKSWRGYMRLAISQLIQCDAIVFLHGWELSAGANIERDLAHKLAMPCMTLDTIGPRSRRHEAQTEIAGLEVQ